MAKIPLSKGYFTLVDDDLFDELNQYKWYANLKGENVYAERTQRYGLRSENKKRHIPMHRYLMNDPKGMLVDHINGNTLDNRKCNLRLATPQQNSVNHSGQPKQRKYSNYKGIKKHTKAKGWSARITVNGKSIYLGSFKTEHDAAYAYDTAALHYFGEYAKLNFKGDTK